MSHIEALKRKFQGGRGRELALAWIQQMVNVARAVVEEAAECRYAPRVQALLEPFFDFVQSRIDTREVKLRMLHKGTVMGDADLFEYLWVFESSLWELCMVGASCLSLRDLQGTLSNVFPRWAPTTTTSETELGETVWLGSSDALARYFFASGSSAAHGLFETLWALGYGPVTLKVDPEQLSTFTPYFEFYQQQGSLLHPKDVVGKAKQRKASRFPRAQMWLNLSDNLHAELLDANPKDIGLAIADMAFRYVEALVDRKVKLRKEIEEDKRQPKKKSEDEDDDAPPDYERELAEVDIGFERLCLVIDFTKFSGDMPNDRLYPILGRIRLALLELSKLSKLTQAVDIVFLRSNLKYNTGSLDRYQSGEVLVAAGGEIFGSQLYQAARGEFKGDWCLRDEYIPLMKRTYVLADAIGFGRWEAYAQVWGGQQAVTRASKSEIDAGAMVVRSRLIGVIDAHLTSILSHLAADLNKPFYKAHLAETRRQKVRDLLKRLPAVRKGLASATTWSRKDVLEVTGLVKEIRASVDAIVEGMNTGAGRILKGDRSEGARNFRSYLARLKSAREKMNPSDEELVALGGEGRKKGSAPKPFDAPGEFKALLADVAREKKGVSLALDKATKTKGDTLKLVLALSVLESIESAATLEDAYRAARSLPKTASLSSVGAREMFEYVAAYVAEGLAGVKVVTPFRSQPQRTAKAWKKIGDLQLDESHKALLEIDVDEYLDDRVIDAFTTIVEQRRANVRRRYDVPVGLLVATQRWVPTQDLQGVRGGHATRLEIQVINRGGNHWIVAVRFPLESLTTAYVYDSLRPGEGIAEEIVTQVRRCFHMGEDDEVEALGGPRQPHGFECGAYVCAAIEVLSRPNQDPDEARDALRYTLFQNDTIRGNMARSIAAADLVGF
ncbi:MAG: Ulp1 family isopeptidase [Minicystis sp.]